MDDIKIDVTGFWCSYETLYVTPPESASYPFDRSGIISIFTLGVHKAIGDLFICVGAEAHYFRESWTNPYLGSRESLDSLSLGPTVGIGTLVDLPLSTMKFEMGLVFPGFSDVWGKIGVSFLLP